MNTTSLAILTLVFGVIIGVTVTHSQHVNHLVEHGVPALVSSADNGDLELGSAASSDEGNDNGKEAVLISNDAKLRELPVKPETAHRDHGRDDALLEILSAIRSEQQAMRRQISESNRDIDELSFRVDTHSDSFKPLNAEMDRPMSMNEVAVPLATGSSGLLPPKQ